MHKSFEKLKLGTAITLVSAWDENILLFNDCVTAEVFVSAYDVVIYLGVRATPEFSSGYELLFLCPSGSVCCLSTAVCTVTARRLV